MELRGKRECKTKAESTMQQMLATGAPRGNPKAAAEARYSKLPVPMGSAADGSSRAPRIDHGKKRPQQTTAEPSYNVKKRACKDKATHIAQACMRKRSRGNPRAAATARFTADTTCDADTPTTLQSIFNNNRVAYDIGAKTLLGYIHRNASYEMQKAYAVLLMATAMQSWGCNISEAAHVSSECTSFSEQTVHKWAASFMTLHHKFSLEPENVSDDEVEEELCSERGRSTTHLSSLIHDESFRLEARCFVRQHAYKKGEPNLTVKQFAQWINATYNVSVHDETARRWLGLLGFSRVHHQKGVYFDGHDRDDVVADRNAFLQKLQDLDSKTVKSDGIVPELPDGEKPVIRMVHDESTYYTNCDQSYFWGDEHTNVLRQKSLGTSIMVSDFVDEVSGFVRDGPDMARFMLETHKDGYFKNEHLLEQVRKTTDIFERIHPSSRALFLFDNAPSHKKVADNALNADKMNVHPGGAQPVMRDTMWEGNIQSMVYHDGTPKGMKAVLEERGIDTKGMIAQDMRKTLKSHPDFTHQTTLLEEYIECRGHICLFYPKYHCELSPIERVSCHSKKHTRAYANGSIVRLRTLVPEGLNSVTTEMIHKFFRTCRDYEKAYREGFTGRDVEKQVKVYKSHRRVT